MITLGWALVHFIWQGALVALLLAVVLRALKGAPAQWRYASACMALLAMAVSVPVTVLWLQLGESSALPPGIRGMVLDGDLKVEPSMKWQQWVVLGWAIGAGVLLIRTAMGWWLARRKSRNGVHWDYPLSRLMERMDMQGSIDLLVSRFADVPQVFGWLKPVIMIPAAAVANLTPAEMEAVLAHELAHIIRRDYLVNLAQTVLESLLFYHPGVWWVSRRIREEREHCCDDIAVKVCGDRRRYSRALLKLEETRPAFAMAATAGGLKMRIMRLMGYPTREAAWGPGVTAAGVVLLMGGLMWATQTPQPPPPPPPPPVVAEAPEAPVAPVVAEVAPVAPVTPAVLVEKRTASGVLINNADQPPPPPPATAPAPRPAPRLAAVRAPQAPPPPPPPPPVLSEYKAKSEQQRAFSAEVRARMAEERAQFEAQKAAMHLDQEKVREDVKRELERALKELQLNKQQMETNIREAMEKAKQQMSDQKVQKEAQASMEKAMAELKAREPEIRKNIQQAMARLEGELKDLEGKIQAERAERERRIEYADQRFSKGDVKGSTTAKGRHYVRYGPPDEIESHAGKGENWLYRNWRGTGGKMIFEFDADGQLKK